MTYWQLNRLWFMLLFILHNDVCAGIQQAASAA
jgi:hypothetical protein